ncbi:MAG: SDR family NAD(P)-dependent oxidoreductase [Patescibacteria group bacterium]
MSHPLNFSGKIVLVTGSTKNLGRATAELFAEHGATVIINSRHDDDVKRTVALLHAKGYSAEGMRADVGEEKEVEEMMANVNDRFGRLDAVVNNAAARAVDNRTVSELKRADWDEMFRTNVLGAFYVSKAALKIMKPQKNGSIINVSSLVAFGKHPAISTLPYAASKGALISFTKGLARELWNNNIRVNAVVLPLLAPRDVMEYAPNIYRDAAAASPKRQLISAKEAAATILFLASEMSSTITGEVVALGGMNNVTTEF